MPRTFTITFTAAEVEARTYMENGELIFVKDQPGVPEGKIPYADLLREKAQEIAPNPHAAFHVTRGFFDVSNGMKKCYLVCSHPADRKVGNPVTYVRANLQPGQGIDFSFLLKCTRCLEPGVEVIDIEEVGGEPNHIQQAPAATVNATPIASTSIAVPIINFRPPHAATGLLSRISDSLNLALGRINNRLADSDDPMALLVAENAQFLSWINDSWTNIVGPVIAERANQANNTQQAQTGNPQQQNQNQNAPPARSVFDVMMPNRPRLSAFAMQQLRQQQQNILDNINRSNPSSNASASNSSS